MNNTTENIKENILKIKAQINAVLVKNQRPLNSVTLVAVSKTRSADEIMHAFAASQTDFGENYLQEAIPKITALSKYNLNWHFIGRIQSNKAKIIANYFSWVQSVASLDIAKILNANRSNILPPLNVCIQININDENKAGVSLAEAEILANAISNLPNLKLRGLMTIPALTQDQSILVKVYEDLNNKFQQLNNQGYNLDTLSMGMSDDYLTAIASGATMVRIGTAIFGPRLKSR